MLLLVRRHSVYSLDNDPSDVMKSGPTRKKWLLRIFFYSFLRHENLAHQVFFFLARTHFKAQNCWKCQRHSRCRLKSRPFLPENILCEYLPNKWPFLLKLTLFFLSFLFFLRRENMVDLFSPDKNKVMVLLLLFFLPTHPKNPCRDPLTKEYTKCRLIRVGQGFRLGIAVKVRDSHTRDQGSIQRQAKYRSSQAFHLSNYLE